MHPVHINNKLPYNWVAMGHKITIYCCDGCYYSTHNWLLMYFIMFSLLSLLFSFELFYLFTLTFIYCDWDYYLFFLCLVSCGSHWISYIFSFITTNNEWRCKFICFKVCFLHNLLFCIFVSLSLLHCMLFLHCHIGCNLWLLIIGVCMQPLS